MNKFDFDLIVIGGGAGGLVAAKLAKGLGKKVAIVEKNKLGGECTWTGCVPSKTFIKIASVAHQLKNLEKFGLSTSPEMSLNANNVMKQVNSIVEKVYSTHTPEVLENLGIKVFIGSPQFLNNHEIKLNDKKLSAKKFIITTGSSPFVPPIKGIDQVSYLTNQTFFKLERLPSSLVVIGGGPIGTELASASNRLGTDVTIIEMTENILAREDKELSQILLEKLKSEGVKILTQTKVEEVAQQENKIIITCSKENQTQTLETNALLIATGRKPNIEKLDLEKAGVEYNKKGVVTNKKLRTTAKNIYACGDVVGPYQFSHMAEYQAIIATKNALLPIKKSVDYSHTIWVTFSDPELARAGMSEEEARALYGEKIKVYKQEYKAIDRSMTDQSEIGLAKFVCTKKGKLLGAHILGSRAGEIIHEVQLGKRFGINFAKFEKVIHAYPAYSDIVKKAARKCYIDLLKNNFWIKLLKKIFRKKQK